MPDCQHLRIVFAGTPDFAATALQALIDSSHDVVGVLTQPDRPAGRGRKLTASPVKALALAHDIEVHQPASFKEPGAEAHVAAWKADVMVVAAYGLILPQDVLDIPPLGCLNIHASLLPRWRGAAPIQRALLNGDGESGVCIMQMDAGLDTGDILLSVPVSLDINMTGGELHDVLADMGAKAIVEVLPARCEGSIHALKQRDEDACYAKKLDKQEARVDFTQAAAQIHRQIQAFNPWPVAETSFNGERIRLYRSRIPDSSGAASTDTFKDKPPGFVGEEGQDGIRVLTGDGVLDILELQRPGKKPMAAVDFSRGLSLLGQVLG